MWIVATPILIDKRKDLTSVSVFRELMNMTSFEVEVKVPLETSEDIQVGLLEIGGHRLRTEKQTDTYYNHPCRSFPDTDEALRLRSIQVLPRVHQVNTKDEESSFELTYKGPKIDPKSKTRLELSVTLDDSSSADSILRELDFKKVAEVVKTRIFYDVAGTTVSIDDVKDVGLFLELESVVHDENKIEETREVIFDILRKLNLDPTTTIRDSYLEMYLGRSSP
jgi:adenylate cyclase class 2